MRLLETEAKGEGLEGSTSAPAAFCKQQQPQGSAAPAYSLPCPTCNSEIGISSFMAPLWKKNYSVKGKL